MLSEWGWIQANDRQRSKEINERYRSEREADQRAIKLRREQKAALDKEAAEKQPKKETP